MCEKLEEALIIAADRRNCPKRTITTPTELGIDEGDLRNDLHYSPSNDTYGNDFNEGLK